MIIQMNTYLFHACFRTQWLQNKTVEKCTSKVTSTELMLKWLRLKSLFVMFFLLLTYQLLLLTINVCAILKNIKIVHAGFSSKWEDFGRTQMKFFDSLWKYFIVKIHDERQFTLPQNHLLTQWKNCGKTQMLQTQKTTWWILKESIFIKKFEQYRPTHKQYGGN